MTGSMREGFPEEIPLRGERNRNETSEGRIFQTEGSGYTKT